MLADMSMELECLKIVHQTKAEEDREANLDIETHIQLPENRDWVDS